MRHIPIILIYSRLVIGFIILILSLYPSGNYAAISITLLTIGLLTDIFDGIIARKLNVSNEKLRRLDSGIDQVFFLTVVAATYIQCPGFYKEHWLKLSLLVALEALTYLISFIKFRKEIATHSIGAKVWTLLLFATLIQLIPRLGSCPHEPIDDFVKPIHIVHFLTFTSWIPTSSNKSGSHISNQVRFTFGQQRLIIGLSY